MAPFIFFAAISTVVLLLHCASAATITVGFPAGGWDLSTDLSSWASSRNFSVGDTLVFEYGSTHDVLEVTESSYDACLPTNALASHSDGNTKILLSTPGKRFFICGVSNHCNSGMKFEIDAISSSPATSPGSNPRLQSPPAPSSAAAGFRAPALTGVLCWMLLFVFF